MYLLHDTYFKYEPSDVMLPPSITFSYFNKLSPVQKLHFKKNFDKLQDTSGFVILVIPK